MHNLLYFAIWYETMRQSRSAPSKASRFRELKTGIEEYLVDKENKAVPFSTNYNNKWASTILANGKLAARKVQVPVFIPEACLRIRSAQSWSTRNSNRRNGCIEFELLAQQFVMR